MVRGEMRTPFSPPHKLSRELGVIGEGSLEKGILKKGLFFESHDFGSHIVVKLMVFPILFNLFNVL